MQTPKTEKHTIDSKGGGIPSANTSVPLINVLKIRMDKQDLNYIGTKRHHCCNTVDVAKPSIDDTQINGGR